MATIKIALAGNPNCGKTTMFNSLTGANQYVGNWPGVTVEKKEGGGSGILSYTADFLQSGLLSLQADYPPYISVCVNRADVHND